MLLSRRVEIALWFANTLSNLFSNSAAYSFPNS